MKGPKNANNILGPYLQGGIQNGISFTFEYVFWLIRATYIIRIFFKIVNSYAIKINFIVWFFC